MMLVRLVKMLWLLVIKVWMEKLVELVRIRNFGFLGLWVLDIFWVVVVMWFSLLVLLYVSFMFMMLWCLVSCMMMFEERLSLFMVLGKL